MLLKFLEALQLGARKKTIRLAGAATASEGPAGASDGPLAATWLSLLKAEARDSKAPAGLSAA